MQRDTDRQKIFTRRALMLGGFQAALLSTLIGRMYYLQVVESARYRTLADENRINLRLLPPPRGRIVDRFGRHVAVNQQNYRVLLVPEDVSKKDQDIGDILDALSQIVPITDNDRRRVFREIRRKRKFVPVTVRENLTWEEVARVEVNTPDLPGVFIDVGETRFYPHGADTAHVLGYVSSVSEDEMTGDPLLELPGFRIGKAGIERIHDLALRGKGGSLEVEVNAVGRVIRELSRHEGQPGAEVVLTIDLELQKMVSRRLEGESASAVIVDVVTGDVLAMASTPSYEPNAFNKGLTGEEWKALTKNPHTPLINKSIAGQYAPGSTFKMIVALAALEKGIINPKSVFYCNGSTQLGDAEFHCWKKHGHGALDLHGAITHSCDVYFYETAKRTGMERISAMARKLGLGQPLGIDLPGEGNGLVPSREWKQAAMKQAWTQGETLILGIGQGYILATPLQLAVMAARLASNGQAVTPHLTRRVTSGDFAQDEAVPQFDSLGISPAHLKVVRDAMTSVVNEPGGTAYGSRIAREGFEMGGKTGTVQVRRISKAERDQGVKKNKDLPWEERDHALFVAFAPADNPRYAAAVVVEHGGSGSQTAAPIVRDILLEAQTRGSAGPGIAGRIAEDDGKPAGARG
ncbi:MAG: penicillin-binding protein 2 [Magnetospirillum sp. WYHS-4]